MAKPKTSKRREKQNVIPGMEHAVLADVLDAAMAYLDKKEEHAKAGKEKKDALTVLIAAMAKHNILSYRLPNRSKKVCREMGDETIRVVADEEPEEVSATTPEADEAEVE